MMDEYCCKGMMSARSFDGPFLSRDVDLFLTVYKVTATGRISSARGSWRFLLVRYCPFCGEELLDATSET
jgi:hypothetical protein